MNHKNRLKKIIIGIILLSIGIIGCGGPSVEIGDTIKEATTLKGFREQILLDGEKYRLIKLIIKGSYDKIVLVRKKDNIILEVWETYDLEKAIATWNTLEKE